MKTKLMSLREEINLKRFLAAGFILLLMLAILPLNLTITTTSASTPSSSVERLQLALKKRGLIPSAANPEQAEAITLAYLRQKRTPRDLKLEGNPLARQKIQANEMALQNAATGVSGASGRKIGTQGTIPPSTPDWQNLEGTDKLLTILVEFSTTPYTWTPDSQGPRTESGPLHNQIPQPNNDFDLWISDFNAQHYSDMLFAPNGYVLPGDQQRGSMHDYYLEQSYGKYTVNGDVYGWYTVNKPEAYYGDDNPSGGSDNLLPGTPKDIMGDVVAVINGGGTPIIWKNYDQLDLYDLDGDGEIDEPDGIIDHPLFVHAGVDQSAGGGAQGDDAIWAHSSSTWVEVGSEPGWGFFGGKIYIYNYVIMPENGGMGVFAHEFGHDLGLPDEYDTIYSGRGASPAFWSLMADGSWTGRPAETMPADMSVWARYVLGWLQPGDNLAVTSITGLASQPGGIAMRLEQVERWGGTGTINAIRINLPPKNYYVNTPYSGSNEWWGGQADLIDTTLKREIDLTGKTSATLQFATWYEIEEGWDFGFVQVSTDNGATWTSLPVSGTTTTHDTEAKPEIVANLPGFTGSSNGWQLKSFDLSLYAGLKIQLQFRYMTDYAVTLYGFFVDNIKVEANGATLFFDDVETLDPAWTVNGWTRTAGSGTKSHYYMLEWRNTNMGFDTGLNWAYSFDPYASNPDQPWWFPYEPGLLLWYRDMTYTDNWVGMHPGHGFLLVVDAHWKPMVRTKTGWPWFTRVQMHDATFNFKKVSSIKLSYFGVEKTYMGDAAIPNFDDSQPYWSYKAPHSSVITPKYGFKFRVLGQADDMSAATILLWKN